MNHKKRSNATSVWLLSLLVLMVGLCPVPVTAQVGEPRRCQELLSNGDFEEEGGWLFEETLLAASIVGAGSDLLPQAYSGEHSLQLGISEHQANMLSHSIAQQGLRVPTGVDLETTLSLWFLPLISGSADDRQYILFQDPRGTILEVVFSGNLTADTWTELTFPVVGLEGQEIVLQLGVFNDGVGEKAQLLVDDVSVQSCARQSLPLAATATSAPMMTVGTATAAIPVAPDGHFLSGSSQASPVLVGALISAIVVVAVIFVSTRRSPPG